MHTQTTAEVRILAAPVVEVTLLEDRAQVTRRGQLDLPAGEHRVRVADVTPLVADRTLRARSQQAEVHDVRVVREWRVGRAEAPPELSEVGEQLEAAQRDHDQLRDRQTLGSKRRQLLDDVLRLQIESYNRLLPWAESYDAEWGQTLERLLLDLARLEEQAFDEQEELRELERTIARLDRRQAFVPAVRRSLTSDLLLDVTVTAAGPCSFEVLYVVPCAQWRPVHRATLLGETVRLESEGAVWQATGEDWTDVQLRFSTARSTQRSEPPLLSDDLLRAQAKRDKSVDVAVREQVIQTTGEGVAGKPQAEGLPGVDDGGETRLLPAASTVNVACDGRMRRVPISSWEGPAEVDRVCRPELARLIHLRSRQANAAPHPLLAGPVDLLRGSGYVGRGELSFVGVGEKFALGWGSEDGLRVHREQREQRGKAMLSGKQTITRTVTLHLSNLDDAPATFAVEERIPVSEINKVTIQVDAKQTQPPATADDQGIVRWDLTLPAHGTREVTLVYTLVASSDVKGL